MKTSDLGLVDLKKLAFSLGRQGRRHDQVIGLVGHLGSGKTTFAKSFAKAFGIRKIKSPTFIIASVYKPGPRHLYHMDFYRLTKLNQLEDIGLQDILARKKRTILIEWVDRFPSIKKLCDILITFKIKKKNKRDVTIKYI